MRAEKTESKKNLGLKRKLKPKDKGRGIRRKNISLQETPHANKTSNKKKPSANENEIADEKNTTKSTKGELRWGKNTKGGGNNKVYMCCLTY